MSLSEPSNVLFGSHITPSKQLRFGRNSTRFYSHITLVKTQLITTRHNIALKSCHHAMQFSWMIDKSDSGPDTVHEPAWLTYYFRGDFHFGIR